jgi:hypothetical protein
LCAAATLAVKATNSATNRVIVSTRFISLLS